MARLMRMSPVLPARNVGDAVHYYTKNLGFRLLFTDVPDHPTYAGVERDGIMTAAKSTSPMP